MFLLLIFICLFKASTSHISLHGNTAAEYGGEAHYKCALSNSTGVLQVTWQKFVKGAVDSMATYSERFGREINVPYRGKLFFTEASFSSSSIILKNLTWEDESCYLCSFNIFPGGSKRSQICLKVHGISKVNTVSHTKQDREVVFSCSATGKPAPTIEWDISDEATPSEQPQTVTVTNSDHTFTTSSNRSVAIPPGWSGHVDCVLNRGKMGERKERIPFSLPDEKEEDEEKSGKGPSLSVIAIISITVIVSCVLLAVFLRKRCKKKDERQSHV